MKLEFSSFSRFSREIVNLKYTKMVIYKMFPNKVYIDFWEICETF